jgi:hypothetical protein
VKWAQIIWQLIRDVMLTGVGLWVIIKQANQPHPSAELLVVALGCIAPAARTAVTTILSGPGSSSESAPHPQLLSSPVSPEAESDGERPAE